MEARAYCGGDVREIDPADISDLIGDEKTLVWVDVSDPNDNDLDCLQAEFNLHPLAMEDVRHRNQRAKLEQYPTHAFVVAYTASLQEVDIFVGPTWLISVRDRDSDTPPWPVRQARARFDRTHPDKATSGFLLYVLLDEIVDGYFISLENDEDALEDLEERIFGEEPLEERQVQQELLVNRRRLLTFRRAVMPLREVVNSLMRRELAWIDQETVTHLQDVYDHVLRSLDLLDAQRELTSNVVDAHLAIISNRMNGVMKTMTSWGAILLGSTLVAGIYGMNFKHIPELEWKFGYFYALGLMLLIALTGYWYFKRRDWL